MNATGLDLNQTLYKLHDIPPFQQWSLLGLITFISWLFLRYRKRQRAWVKIPTIGFSDPVLSYFSALKNIMYAKKMLTAGYTLDKQGMFKAPEIGGWHVYICGPKLIEELCKLPDDIVDIQAAAKITLQGEYTLSPAIFSNGYHIPIIRYNLTRALPTIFPVVVDELKVAFEEYVPCPPASDEWITVKALDSMMRIVCRASNISFVGLPLCRNEEYMDVMLKYTIDVILGAYVIGLFPKFLRPFAGRFVSNTRRRFNAVKKHTFPMIEERYRKLKEHNGDWACLPNDMLTWHMQTAEDVEKTPTSLTHRMLMINFVSLHTTSMVSTWVLFHLAAYPEYVPALREEIHQVFEDSEWSSAVMNTLLKLDSFIKEVMRVRPVAGATISRLTLRDFTFTNGTFIPAGTKISVAADPQHFDREIYGENTAEFDGFRFTKHKDDGGINRQLATSTSDYVAFGYGRHICPGRHFAVNEIKALICHVLMNYDLKFSNPKLKYGEVPDAIWLGTLCALDSNVELMFKRRKI